MRKLKDTTRESGNEEVAIYSIKLLCKQKKLKFHFIIWLNIVFYVKTKKNQNKHTKKPTTKAEEKCNSFAEKGTSQVHSKEY